MPKIVAVAIVKENPPTVLIAEDMETLNWVLALRMVARTDPSEIGSGLTATLRDALLEERWADAVYAWMDALGLEVDIYPSEDMHTARDVELAASELQFTPLFRDGIDPG